MESDVYEVDSQQRTYMEQGNFNFFFSSRRRHTRCSGVSWARRCVQETGYGYNYPVEALAPTYPYEALNCPLALLQVAFCQGIQDPNYDDVIFEVYYGQLTGI
eukprot:TRINITY_DN4327_c0_g1_i4.p4 TRINITY_DN4327_c0_g1~~TRINITY_DN4327_c0_g1_i4.p4  ORF type:complete len:103 (-),score=31.27 TRINITY_DN4327_c0_g1_i4:144-452(-)